MFRPIYEPRTRAREYCDLAVNIYTGCNNGCTYCYAPRVLRKSREQFATDVRPRDRIVESVCRQIEREGLVGQKIMLCFTCDPYPAGIDTTTTRDVIKAIKESGNHVQILTKGGERAVRDFDLLDRGDSFGVTISGGENISEPNAACPEERIDTLAEAHQSGITTWVSCEPVLEPSAIFNLVRRGIFIDLFRIGKLNYSKDRWMNWGEFGRKIEAHCKAHGRNYYIKEDLRAEMEKVGERVA